MSAKEITSIQIWVEGPKIVFCKNKNPNDQTFDPSGWDDFSEFNVRIELEIAKVFHKVLNLIKADQDLFQKQDFELLGEMLSKILFGKGTRDFRKTFMTEILQTLETGTSADRCCRIYLEFDWHSKMAGLPWEYALFRSQADNNAIYLSALKKSRFHLIRRFNENRFNENKCEHPDQDMLFVIVLFSCEGSNNAKPVIDQRLTEIAEVKKMFLTLQQSMAHAGKLEVAFVDTACEQTLNEDIEAIVNKWEQQYGYQPAYMVHYLGHGILENQIGQLAMKPDTQSDIDWIKDSDLAAYFSKAAWGNLPRPSIVAFQACNTAKIGDINSSLHGVAYEFTRIGIPAVVGMQNEINTGASCAFFEKFYDSLLRGEDTGFAVTTGRDYLGRDYRTRGQLYKNNYFGSPVLFITTDEPIRMMKPAQPLVQETMQFVKEPGDIRNGPHASRAAKTDTGANEEEAGKIGRNFPGTR